LIDNLKATKPIDLPSKFWKKIGQKKDLFNHFYLFPRYHYVEKGKLYKYEGMLENLQITIIRETKTLPNRLIIENSWHKFLKGNNHSDYKFSDIETTIHNLEEILDLSIMDADINRIEYACNINLQPESVYNTFLLSRNKELKNMLDDDKRYGKKLYRDKYRFKCYDKKYQANLKEGDSILRIEMESKCKGYLRSAKIPIEQVKDLLIKDNLKLFKKDLIKKYNSIDKRIMPNFDELSSHQINVWAAMNNILVRNHYKEFKYDTYKSYKKKFKEINATGNSDIHSELVSKVSDKWDYLLNN